MAEIVTKTGMFLETDRYNAVVEAEALLKVAPPLPRVTVALVHFENRAAITVTPDLTIGQAARCLRAIFSLGDQYGDCLKDSSGVLYLPHETLQRFVNGESLFPVAAFESAALMKRAER